jgi:hypothetical protein
MANKIGGNQSFVDIGTKTSEIDVRISYKIIKLFSEGLYSSPNKAVEELVSNSFDAGATKVHVILSPDLTDRDSTIAVIDNGTGMDEEGLREHWLIGVSNKRPAGQKIVNGRKQIGKFGIGKLASYVLATRLSHICKVKKKYYATSMDYSKIEPTNDGDIQSESPVKLPLRELSKKEAKDALSPWLQNKMINLQLFGEDEENNWTIAIMSALKPMATEISRGKLKRILSTTMPLHPEFKLYLDGHFVTPSKLSGKKNSWIIGKDIKVLPKPAPDELEVTVDEAEGKDSIQRFGLSHSLLGRITGKVELYEDLLTTGKSGKTERSHGFFVYVHGRLVNLEDEYFGIDSNLLRHGTFSRVHIVVYIDSLDEILRSSREALKEGALLNTAREFLRGVFNFVRTQHEIFEEERAPGVLAVRRLASSPYSLTRRPVLNLIISALEKKCAPKYINYPRDLKKTQQDQFIAGLYDQAAQPEGLVRHVRITEDLSQHQGIALFDASEGILKINALHPFVAYFLSEYEDRKRNLPLELLAISEVLQEASLYEIGIKEEVIDDIMMRRDELLRYLAKSTGKKNALIVSQNLIDAANDKSELELQLVAAFERMGFTDAIPLGGSGKPDGYAEAHLGASETGEKRSYKVSLEAKSKEKPGEKVTAKTVGISTIARHRNDHKCNHAVVVGPDFPTSDGNESALGKEIAADREAHPDKTITLIRIHDMARLIRLVPAKRISLHRLQDLFKTCSLPEESKDWIDKIAKEKPGKHHYKELLKTIASEQKEAPKQAVTYSSIMTRLRMEHNIIFDNAQEIKELCKSLSSMVPEYVTARELSVDLTTNPETVLSSISSYTQQYPEEEQRGLIF